MRESEGCDGAASQGFQRRRRNHVDTPERRADRAQSLIMMGEVSAGRRALEGAPLAPGTRHTLDQLQDPVRRPTTPYAPLPDALQHHRAEMAFALDTRRLEVVADGLPLFHGAQVAVDTTLVSPLRRDGTPHVRCAGEDGAALLRARRRKERAYPELSGEHGRARLVVLASEVVVPSTTCEGQDAPCASRSTDQCQDGVDLAVEHDSRVRKCSCLCSVSLGKARHSGA